MPAYLHLLTLTRKPSEISTVILLLHKLLHQLGLT